MPQAAGFNFPDPNYEAQNQALRKHWHQNTQAITVLQNVGMDHEARQLAIRGLAELSDRAYTMARTLGLHAIAQGDMSRVELSRLLGVHQGTVATWIEQAQNRTRPRLHRDTAQAHVPTPLSQGRLNLPELLKVHPPESR